MAVYTVHQPPRRSGDAAPDPERFVLVRDGFHGFAFLFGPFWLAWRRLWLVLVLYVALLIGLEALLRLVGAGAALHALVLFALALLLGLEAASLRRWTLARRGWSEAGIVVGDDREAAERRFFAHWTEAAAPASRARAQAAAFYPAQRRPGSEVIGLFPEADPRR